MINRLRLWWLYDVGHWYRHRTEAAAVWAAGRLPRWLVYRAAIRCGVHATTGPYSRQVVPELSFMEALQRWR